MKKLLFFITICFASSLFTAEAQSDTLYVASQKDTLKTQIQKPTVKLDDLTLDYLDYIIGDKINECIPRYKMYPTQNINILLKLDTATGRVWMVQYRMGKDSSAMEIPIDNSILSNKGEHGLYELYPTHNIYTFILIDTKFGTTYQVQWGTEPNKRFRERIY